MACIRKKKIRGHYVIDFYDQVKERQRLFLPKGTTRDQAKEELRKIELQVAKGIYLPEKRTPAFQEVAEDWIEYKRPNLRENTWEIYEGHVRNHFHEFNGQKINLITTAKVERYITGRQTSGMHILTLRKVLVTLGQILNYAVRHRYIDHNPLREAERPRDPGEGKKEIVVLTIPEIQAFLAGVKDQKYRTMFMLAVMSGVRQGELLGLKWGDLDLTDKQLHIQRTFTKGRFFNTKTKTSTRRVDLGPAVISELRRWKLACPPSGLDLMFPNDARELDGKPNGKPINYTNMVTRHFRPALLAMVAKNLDTGRAAKNLEEGNVSLPLAGHGFHAGAKIVITGTRNYDGERFILPSSTPDQIHIRAGYTAERMTACSWAILEKDVPAFTKLSRFRFHDLRHTYASLLIHQKESIKYIQDQLGHCSPMVTLNVYAHLMDSRNQDAACRLEDAVFGNGHVLGTKRRKGQARSELTP
ncbi:MAG: tyrosine-type recombinase/integrase [Syntrophobacteraceae bacterium]